MPFVKRDAQGTIIAVRVDGALMKQVFVSVLGQMRERWTLAFTDARAVTDVAEQVAHGASNREIAARLDITERTVKAHLSSIFEKFGVRDRVQLALTMNNIPTYSTIN